MRVCFRMEGSRNIGMGHVMRCLALARELVAQGHEVMFLCGRSTARAIRVQWPVVPIFLVADGLEEMRDAQKCSAILRRESVDWLVVDHYGLGVRFERCVRDSVAKILAIDDVARRHVSDVVLDTALQGKRRYNRKLGIQTQGWFGPRFALLRAGVLGARVKKTKNASRLFVSFGGADALDMTLRVATLLTGKYTDVDFVVGYAYRGKEELLAISEGQKGWRLHVNHDAPEMLMAQAQVAIGAGGGMTWERCAVGVASVVVSIAQNQESMCEALAAEGVICYLGRADEVEDNEILRAVEQLRADENERRRMMMLGRAMVDARGAVRVAAMMRRLM